MFKNCCGCPGKKANRKESEEDQEEDDKKEEVAEDVPEVENAAPDVGQEAPEKVGDGAVDSRRKPSSLKKPKPRLSISADVKIIPSNYPEEYEDSVEEDAEEEKDDEEDEEDEEDVEPEVKITVKDIDGKMIRKSQSAESSRKPSLEGDPRTNSPLSDEVFVASEKSHLELPLHNLGVKVEEASPLGTDGERSPKKQPPNYAQKRVSMPAVLPKWLSEEDETGGSQEPPATPVSRQGGLVFKILTVDKGKEGEMMRVKKGDTGRGNGESVVTTFVFVLQVARDELALRRHRFFSELLTVAQAATEHRVRFDPFGPTIEILSEVDQGSTQAQTKEFENLLKRLENVTLRLEKAVPLIEKGAEACARNLVVTKSLEDLLDEHLTPTERESLNLLVNCRPPPDERGTGEEDSQEKDGFIIISPDSSADFDELSDRDLILAEDGEGEKVQNNASDRSENSSNSQTTVVSREVEGKREEGKEKESNEVKKGKEKAEMTNSQSTLSMSVQGFQQVVQGPLTSYLQISSRIGGDVAEQARMVQEAFQAQLQYLSLAAQSGKPSQAVEMNLLQPTSEKIEAIQSYREKHRSSPFFNHLSAISESIPALGWVTVSPAPAPYVKEMNDAGQFYTNRVLKDWKEKDKIHVEWTKAWIQTLSELQAFVKQHHTTGLVWGGTSAPRAGGAPPPPPPVCMPPPPPVLDLGDVAPSPGQDRSALFAEINQGENITRNLKRVTPEMQTHKNPAVRSGPTPFKSPPSSIANQVPKPFKAASPPEKAPKFAREGKKWLIEHQKGNHQLVVENAEMNNVVYLYKCQDSTLVVKGKVNSIFLDSCKKTAVVFDSVVSSIEFVNCQSVQMQVLGAVPTISIDKTDGCQMYLSQDSLNVEIVSSKSSEMNVLVPAGSGDFKEYPVPEQFKTTVSKQGLTTVAVESKG